MASRTASSKAPGSSTLKRTSGCAEVPMNSWWKRTPGLGGEEPFALGDVREIGEEQLAAWRKQLEAPVDELEHVAVGEDHWTARRRPTRSRPGPAARR